jgi:hypothetical protein
MGNLTGAGTSSGEGLLAGGRFGKEGVTEVGGTIRRAEDSTSSYAISEVRLVSVAAGWCCATTSSTEPAGTRTARVRAMNSSTSL